MLGILSGIISAAFSVVKTLSIVDLSISALKVVAGAIFNLCKALGIIEDDTKMDELGDKALQSEYNPEDYDCYEEYVKAVEKFELDPEKSKEITAEQKMAKGVELVSGLAIEKYRDYPMKDLLVLTGQKADFFDGDRGLEVGKLIKEDNSMINSLVKYFNGSEKDEVKIDKMFDSLIEIEKKIDPDISENEAFKNVLSLRSNE